MCHKGGPALLAMIMLGLAGVTAAWAHGGGAGDYPAAVGYPYLFSLNSERACHVVQRRVLTRSGWRTFILRKCS
jgi:hypothetical protein